MIAGTGARISIDAARPTTVVGHRCSQTFTCTTVSISGRERRRRREATGDMIIVNYADEASCPRTTLTDRLPCAALL